MNAIACILSLAVLAYFGWLVVNAALWLIGIVGSRFDAKPRPYGVHGIAAGHPERGGLVELSDHERDVLLQLDVRTEWEDA